MTQDEIVSGSQCVEDISGAILLATGACLKVHGNDPNSPAIVTAGFCLAIDKITKSIDPTFRKRLLERLNAFR